MKLNLTMLAALACATGAKAQDLTDSLHVHQLQTVVVKAVRASKEAPFAVRKPHKRYARWGVVELA